MFTDSGRSLQAFTQFPDSIALSGLSYRETPIELRERFSIDPAANQNLLQRLLDHPEVREAVVLSTCNRTEIVTAGPRISEPSAVASGGQSLRLVPHPSEPALHLHIAQVLAEHAGVPIGSFFDNMYHLHDSHAVGHLFKVAAGIDSMIVGEPQVLGQLKAAFSLAAQGGATSGLLNGLFQRAFSVAKAIRTETKIGHQAVSVCYAARELAVQIFGELNDATVMMLGTGETGRLALKHFQSAGVSKFFVASHSLARAAEIAEPIGGVALELASSGMVSFLPQADVVIGASLRDSSEFLVSRGDAERAARTRRGKPQFFIDLGVPRNFDPGVGELSDAFLYDIDDLGSVVQRNLDNRSVEVKRAELIVDAQVERFAHWLERRQAGESIRRARTQLDRYRSQELEKTRKRLRRGGMSDAEWERIAPALEDLAESLTAKVMHRPLTLLNRATARREEVSAAFEDFFVEPRPVLPEPDDS